jgi:hypothetical protein
MPTILEFSKQFKIPVSKLRKVEAAGYLTFEPEEQGPIAKVIARLRTGQALTVEHLRFLILNPDAVELLDKDMIGASDNVLRQLRAIGDASGEALAADKFPHNLIIEAAKNEPEALESFARWIASIIPAKGCNYHYVAIRAALNVPDSLFELAYRSLRRAIFNARKHEALEGMSAAENRATKFFPRNFPQNLVNHQNAENEHFDL